MCYSGCRTDDPICVKIRASGARTGTIKHHWEWRCLGEYLLGRGIKGIALSMSRALGRRMYTMFGLHLRVIRDFREINRGRQGAQLECVCVWLMWMKGTRVFHGLSVFSCMISTEDAGSRHLEIVVILSMKLLGIYLEVVGMKILSRTISSSVFYLSIQRSHSTNSRHALQFFAVSFPSFQTLSTLFISASFSSFQVLLSQTDRQTEKDSRCKRNKVILFGRSFSNSSR